MAKTEQELLQLGLNQNEAKIYLAALSMGPFKAGAIAAKTKIKRATTYLALENLKKLGLIMETFEHKRKLFKAEKPSALEKLTKRMRRKVINAEILLERLLPSLNSLADSQMEEPKLSFHEGIDSVKNVLLDIAASKQPWFLFGASWKTIMGMYPNDLKEVLEEGSKLRHQAGLPKIKFISDQSVLAVPDFKKVLPSRETKVLSKHINAKSTLIIYEDKLAIFNFSHPFAAVIKSAEAMEIIKLMYDLIWESL